MAEIRTHLHRNELRASNVEDSVRDAMLYLLWVVRG
jgi:hypothetical protein